MKEIPLTQNKVALVDDEDFENLSQFKWTAHHKGRNWYAVRAISQFKNGKHRSITIPMHRVITNCPDGSVVDHINHDGLNNQKENLRVVSIAENSRNQIGSSHDVEKLKYTKVKLLVFLDNYPTTKTLVKLGQVLDMIPGVISARFEAF